MDKHLPCQFISEQAGHAFITEPSELPRLEVPVVAGLATEAMNSATDNCLLVNAAEQALTALACSTCVLSRGCPLQAELQQRRQQSDTQLAGILNILA